jgi:hypothetical protein
MLATIYSGDTPFVVLVVDFSISMFIIALSTYEYNKLFITSSVQ